MALSWAEPWFGLSDQDIRRISSDGPSHRAGTVSALSQQDVQFPIQGEAAQAFDPALLRLASSQIVATLTPLMDLPHDWDSYGGRPLTPKGAEFAEKVVVPLLVQGVATPAFVPTSDGGLSLEWHLPGVQLLIQIPGAPDEDPPTVFFADGASEWEAPLIDSLPRVRSELSRFTEGAR